MGTFYSEEDFDAHVDDVVQFGGGTDIVNGKLPKRHLNFWAIAIYFQGYHVHSHTVYIYWLIGSIKLSYLRNGEI